LGGVYLKWDVVNERRTYGLLLRGIGAEVDVTIRNIVGLLNASKTGSEWDGGKTNPNPGKRQFICQFLRLNYELRVFLVTQFVGTEQRANISNC
jgi:hypothetical protein